VQLLGDLAVGLARGTQPEHLQLAGRKRFGERLRAVPGRAGSAGGSTSLARRLMSRMTSSWSTGDSPPRVRRTAPTSSEGPTPWRTYPAAPALIAASGILWSAWAISTRRLVRGNSAFIAWVAAIPSIVGIERYIRGRTSHEIAESVTLLPEVGAFV
jgi:hypothetical protein